MNKRVKSTDKLMAQGIDALSKLCAGSRAVGDFVIGQDEPRRWRVSETPAASLTNWIETPGYFLSGRRPATYRRIIQIETDAHTLQEQAERDWPNAVPAVAFAVGSALVTADLSIKEIIEMNEFVARSADGEMPQSVAVAMGVGKAMLRTTIGVRSLSENTFTQAEGPVIFSGALELPHGQRADAALIEQRFPNAHIF